MLMISVRGIIPANLVRERGWSVTTILDAPAAISRDAKIIYIQGAMKQRRWVAGYNLRCEANELSGITPAAGAGAGWRMLPSTIRHLLSISMCARCFRPTREMWRMIPETAYVSPLVASLALLLLTLGKSKRPSTKHQQQRAEMQIPHYPSRAES